MAVGGTENVRSVQVAAVEEGHLCLLQEVEVASLHVQEEAGGRTGSLEVSCPGREVGGRSGFAEAEGSEQSHRSPAKEAEAPVCQVVVEVHLLCSPTS